MVGFNRRDSNSDVPFKHSLVPVYIWFRDREKIKD